MNSACDIEELHRKIDASARMKMPYDLLITDVVVLNRRAMELLPWIKKNHPEISVIIVFGVLSWKHRL